MPLRTTPRITAFRPGQSPPPLRTPTRTCRTYCGSATPADRSPGRGHRARGLRRPVRGVEGPRPHAHDLLEPADAWRVRADRAGGGRGGEPGAARSRVPRGPPPGEADPARLDPRGRPGLGARSGERER